MYKRGVTRQIDIAQRFDTSQAQISRIVLGRRFVGGYGDTPEPAVEDMRRKANAKC